MRESSRFGPLAAAHNNPRDIADEHEIDRIAWLLQLLCAINDHGASDRRLLRWAVEIDERAMRCRNYDRPHDWGLVGASRRRALPEGLRAQLQSLLRCVEAADTPASLYVAWWGASPHVRELVLLAPGDHAIYNRLQLQRDALIAALRSAMNSMGRGRPRLRPRPPKLAASVVWDHEAALAKALRDIASAISLRPLYRVFTDADAFRFGKRPGDTEGVLFDLAHAVSERYQLPRPLVRPNTIHRLKPSQKPRKKRTTA